MGDNAGKNMVSYLIHLITFLRWCHYVLYLYFHVMIFFHVSLPYFPSLLLPANYSFWHGLMAYISFFVINYVYMILLNVYIYLISLVFDVKDIVNCCLMLIMIQKRQHLKCLLLWCTLFLKADESHLFSFYAAFISLHIHV